MEIAIMLFAAAAITLIALVVAVKLAGRKIIDVSLAYPHSPEPPEPVETI